MLNPADRETIASAVAAAERSTSGEIVCVTVPEVSRYREVPLAWAIIVALAGPPLALLAGLRLEGLASRLAGWTAAHGPASAGPVLSIYAFGQLALFVIALAAFAVPAVRRRLTPRSLKRHRVRRAALQQLAAVRLHLTPGQTAVVIFAALGERQMEIVADEAIHAKVGDALWDRAVAEALAVIAAAGPAAGLARAVEICGAALAEHFPDDGRPNAYPDAALEL